MDNSFYLEDAEIIKQLFLKSPHLQSNSLYKGKMGIVLFLYEFANLTQNDAFKRFASFFIRFIVGRYRDGFSYKFSIRAFRDRSWYRAFITTKIY